jgi:hypothetical protein
MIQSSTTSAPDDYIDNKQLPKKNHQKSHQQHILHGKDYVRETLIHLAGTQTSTSWGRKKPPRRSKKARIID